MLSRDYTPLQLSAEGCIIRGALDRSSQIEKECVIGDYGQAKPTHPCRPKSPPEAK